jgi:hypothetical protein
MPKDVNNNPNVKIEMFVTYIGSNDTVPVPPLMTFPKNDSLDVDTASLTYLKWKAQPDGIIYHVEVSTDSTFAVITNTVNTPELFYGLSAGLISNTKYFWRVNTNNGGHFSPWSPVWHFKTLAPYSDVGINKNTLIKEQPLIFPNPSSGKFTFSNIEKGNLVKIFDISGKLISESVAKENSIIIDLEGKDKGVYTYRISNSKQEVRQGKLVVK